MLISRDDDVAAVCGRVDSAVTYAVVVHAPKGNRQLSQELGMRRLRRHAEESGKLVAIATRSGALANRARQTGVPVARKPQHVRWDSGGRFVFRIGPWSVLVPRLGALVQLVVMGLILAFGAGLALALVPSATVTLSPPTATLNEVLTLTASESQESANVVDLVMPMREVSSTQRLTVAVRTTGKTSTPTKQAKALVTMTNSGPTEVSVPGGAVLLSKEGEQFTLDLQTTVPPRGVVTQSATAAKPGAQGNIPAASLTRWQDAGIQGRLTVTNAQPASGGASEERPAVDAADIATVKALAKGIESSETARRTILAGRPRDGVFLSTAKAAVAFGEPNAAAGANADFLFLDVDVTVTAMAIPQQALESVVRSKLGAKAPGPLVPGSVSAVEAGAAETNQQGAMRNAFQISARFAEAFDEHEVESVVRGKSKADAEAALGAEMAEAKPSLKLWPSWAPWTPRFGFRIDVDLADPTADGSGEDTFAPAAAATTSTPLASATPSATPTPPRSPTPSATRRP
ncbi:MAG: baseplate J/gp47 family protein [Dehalococcoidia bacterium]